MTLNNIPITREQTGVAVRALVYQAEARRRVANPDCASPETCRACRGYCPELGMTKQQMRSE